ncbi:hypothetical protein AOXY_G2303, partial [Acipenser oxyrinchus oxyrinchus]
VLDPQGRGDWIGDPIVEKISKDISFLGYVNDTTKSDFTKAAAGYYTSVINRAQIEDFKEGLETFGIVALLRQYPDVFKSLLCGHKKNKTDEIYDMYEAQLSKSGSNQRDLDEEAMMHFMMFLSGLTNQSKLYFYCKLLIYVGPIHIWECNTCLLNSLNAC